MMSKENYHRACWKVGMRLETYAIRGGAPIITTLFKIRRALNAWTRRHMVKELEANGVPMDDGCHVGHENLTNPL